MPDELMTDAEAIEILTAITDLGIATHGRLGDDVAPGRAAALGYITGVAERAVQNPYTFVIAEIEMSRLRARIVELERQLADK